MIEEMKFQGSDWKIKLKNYKTEKRGKVEHQSEIYSVTIPEIGNREREKTSSTRSFREMPHHCRM